MRRFLNATAAFGTEPLFNVAKTCQRTG